MYSGQVEGDMILTPLQKDLLYNTERRHRTGLINLTRKWTNNEIPYKIAKENFSKFFKHLRQIFCENFENYLFKLQLGYKNI